MRQTPQHDRRRLGSVPLWSWANVLSMDSVVVGLLWQLAFSHHYLRRLPATYELLIIGLSIWLVYAADHLLDSLRLSPDRPHALRHRFYLVHRRVIGVIWFSALALNTTLVFQFASESQLRWGSAAVAVVCGYVLSVQLGSEFLSLLPKELLAGMIIAFGVSLTCWSEISSEQYGALLLSTVLSGMLFSTNCCAIAAWEQNIDRDQHFRSWLTQHPSASQWLPIGIFVQVAAISALMVAGLLPSFIGICLLVSHALLLALLKMPCNPHADDHDLDATRLPVILADATLVMPPMLMLVVNKLT